MPIIVSLDIGTSKSCALALDVESLVPLAVRSGPNDADVPGLPPGFHEQDPLRLHDRALELLREVAADEAVRAGDIVGLGITGQMHGVLLIDGALRPQSNLVTWRDRRTLQPGQDGEAKDASQAAADAQRTGCALHAGYGGVTLRHTLRHGRLPQGSTAVTIADFLVACLTGVAATEPTHAASWGLLNLRQGQWDQEMVGRLGLPTGILPEIRRTSCPLAAVRGDLARWLEIPRGTLVCSPIGDNQASIVGVAGLASDVAVVNLGTGGQVSIPQSDAAWVEGFETRPRPFGGHVLVGASLCGGWSYAYLRRFFQEVVRQFAGIELSDEDAYQRMNCLAAEAACGAGGLSADTRFGGTRGNSGLRGALCSINTRNFTPGNLARSFVEGMVRELAEMFHRAAGARVARVVASGNAVRHSGHTFAFYGAMMVLQLFWVLWIMPETKGVPLEEIQKKLGIE